MERRRHLIYTSRLALNSGLYPKQLVLEVIYRFWIHFLESWITKLQKALPIWVPVLTLILKETGSCGDSGWSLLRLCPILVWKRLLFPGCRGAQKIAIWPEGKKSSDLLVLEQLLGHYQNDWELPQILISWASKSQEGQAEMVPHLRRKNISWNELLICGVPSKQSKGTKQPLSANHKQKTAFF